MPPLFPRDGIFNSIGCRAIHYLENSPHVSHVPHVNFFQHSEIVKYCSSNLNPLIQFVPKAGTILNQCFRLLNHWFRLVNHWFGIVNRWFS